MSQRMLVRLIGAAAFLAAVWVVVASLSGRRTSAETAASDLAAALDQIDPAAIDAVRISGTPGAIALEHVGSHWTVNGFRADSGLVAGFLDAISAARVTDLVARNPQNHGRMGVSADSAASVTFESAGSERTLLVGKSGPGYGTAYVRLPDQDAVYLADGGFRTHIVRAFDAWRDSRIVAVDTAAVERVQVRRADAEYVVARADSAWIVDDDEPADPAAVRNILAELADLRGSGFLADADSVAMQPAALWVTALGASGDTLAAVSIGAGAGDRWARSRGDSVIYRLSSWRIDRLAPMHEALRGS